MSPAPQFSVIIPTLGNPQRLETLINALAAQTLDRAQWEWIVALDAPALDAPLEARIVELGGVRVARLGSGPGAARNRGAEAARGEWLAFTEDDCTPAPDWLERAAAAIAAAPEAQVIAGSTTKPGGRPVHRQRQDAPLYLPTNLFVRRELFTRSGGYCEDFFDAPSRVYFREDSDFGFTLEALGAHVVAAPDVRVEHPDEHLGFWDPLRWARRHMMDPLLAARHPQRFREAIEVHTLGPIRIRRPIVRACVSFVLALIAAAIASALGSLVLGAELTVVALAALLVVWAKWRFDPRRLLVVPLVPFVLVAALVKGASRARQIARRSAR